MSTSETMGRKNQRKLGSFLLEQIRQVLERGTIAQILERGTIATQIWTQTQEVALCYRARGKAFALRNYRRKIATMTTMNGSEFSMSDELYLGSDFLTIWLHVVNEFEGAFVGKFEEGKIGMNPIFIKISWGPLIKYASPCCSPIEKVHMVEAA